MAIKPVEISENIFRIGASEHTGGLITNVYLLNDGDESVLFGCGSAADFDITFSQIAEITKVERIKYVILQDHDSSLSSGMPLLENKGFSGQIVTHLNLSPYIKYYGIKSGILYSNLNANRLFLKSGRVIRFFNTPYLKSAGSFSAYDSVSGVLFSGDLFSAISAECGLFADKDYIKYMKKYHSEYMPDKYMLQFALESIASNDIRIIAPHHGSVIRDNVADAFRSLSDVECGSLFTRIKFSSNSRNTLISILNGLLKHYYSLFSISEVSEIFSDGCMLIDENTGSLIVNDLENTDLWNYFFEKIYSSKGYSWLALAEKDLNRIKTEYRIDYPDIYNSYISDIRQKYEKLEKEKTRLAENLQKIEMNPDYNSAKDPLAQVYKEDMFRENLATDIESCRELGIDFAFFILEIDNLPALNLKYGRDAGDELLSNTAYLLKNFKKNNKNYVHHLIFRMNGPRFTYYCNDATREEIISIAEEIRTEFRESRLFITNITVSIGVIHSSEFSMDDKDPSELSASIIETANSRLRLARHNGIDSVCSESESGVCFDYENYIIVIDPDISVRYMLETHLIRAGFNVITCAMGDEALKIIDTNKPAVIVSEVMLPKIDGFTLRKRLLEDSALKDIPFILTSSIKDETSIIRAQSLGIYNFLKKPYPLIEITGLVKKLSESEQ